LLNFSSLFCAPLAWDFLHRLGLWRASDGCKAVMVKLGLQPTS